MIIEVHELSCEIFFLAPVHWKIIKQFWVKRHASRLVLEILVARGSDHVENREQLVALCLPLENRVSSYQLAQNTACSPHVNRTAILGNAPIKFFSWANKFFK